MAMKKDEIPEYGSLAWGLYQYEQAKKAMRGHNYKYYNEAEWKKLEEKGYKFYEFSKGYEARATSSEISAQEIVKKLRAEGNSARIIVGYHKNVQKQKMFSVIFKPKKK
jgi:hypothetical protein